MQFKIFFDPYGRFGNVVYADKQPTQTPYLRVRFTREIAEFRKDRQKRLVNLSIVYDGAGAHVLHKN